MRPRPSISPLFPYTTLFRSIDSEPEEEVLSPVDENALHAPPEPPPAPIPPAAAVPAAPPVQPETAPGLPRALWGGLAAAADRKSTRLNSSHLVISYAVFCFK